jgi:hypothetical protein
MCTYMIWTVLVMDIQVQGSPLVSHICAQGVLGFGY